MTARLNIRIIVPCIAALLSGLMLAACAGPMAAGRGAVAALTAGSDGHAPVLAATDEADQAAPPIDDVTAAPLTVDAAVTLALRRNPALRASLATLDIAEADLQQAGRLRNPGFRFARLAGGQDLEIERGLSFDLFGLLTRPWRMEIESRRFEQATLRAALAAQQLISATQYAYFNAVAAQQLLLQAGQIRAAAQSGAELAAAMRKAGNWNALQQARQQAFHDEALSQFSRSNQQAMAAREQLLRLLGLDADDPGLFLPALLPDLPPALQDIREAESLAMERRLDVMIARQDTLATASALGLRQRTGLINVFDAGYQNKDTGGQGRMNGYEIAFELPLFDWGGARVARAQASYMAAVHEAAGVAVRARSQVRLAHADYQRSYGLARRYRDEVLPQRRQVSAQLLLRYNGMLNSVFDLLEDCRAQLRVSQQAVIAQRDFWIARTALLASIHAGTAMPEVQPADAVRAEVPTEE